MRGDMACGLPLDEVKTRPGGEGGDWSLPGPIEAASASVPWQMQSKRSPEPPVFLDGRRAVGASVAARQHEGEIHGLGGSAGPGGAPQGPRCEGNGRWGVLLLFCCFKMFHFFSIRIYLEFKAAAVPSMVPAREVAPQHQAGEWCDLGPAGCPHCWQRGSLLSLPPVLRAAALLSPLLRDISEGGSCSRCYRSPAGGSLDPLQGFFLR